jgi:hypothetical protein
MNVRIVNGTKKANVSLGSGDIILFPRIGKYGYGVGTIDCFNYFK